MNFEIIISLVSLIFAGGLYFFPLPELTPVAAAALAIGLIIISLLVLLFQIIITVNATSSLQKSEQNLTPRIFELYSHDSQIGNLSLIPIIFLFTTVYAAIDILFLNFAHKDTLLPLWILFLGLCFATMYHLSRRIYSFLSPSTAVDLYAHKASVAIREGQDREFCNWIDVLSEISLKAINRDSSSLCQHALDTMQRLYRDYLEASKSLTHRTSTTEGTGTDTVSYSLFFYFQRLEIIFNKALQKHLEIVCGDIITSLGKVTFYAAKYDITMATYPIHYIGKFAKKAQENQMPDVANRATLTLIEVSKILLNEIDITYAELKDPFFSIISHMQDLAKEAFRMDRKTDIRLLTQPFLDLKELFKSDKVAKHPDTPAIVQNIDRALEEFQMLDEVLRTMPPLPDMPTK